MNGGEAPKGAAEFYNSTFTIRLNRPEAEVAAYVQNPPAAAVDLRAAFTHELHHFYNSVGTTFGWLLLWLRVGHAHSGGRLAGSAQDRDGRIHKPVLPWIEGATPDRLKRPDSFERVRDEAAKWKRNERVAVGLLRQGEAVSLGEVAVAFLSEASSVGLAAAYENWTREDPNRDDFDAMARKVEEKSGTDSDFLREYGERVGLAWRKVMDQTPAGTDFDAPSCPDLGHGPIDWHCLLEGAAKEMEHAYLLLHSEGEPPSAWRQLESPYTRALRTMQLILKKGRRKTGWIEFLMLFDLAVNPPLDPGILLPDGDFTPAGMFDVLPGWRFVRACEAAVELEPPPLDCPPEELDSAYRDYGGRLCAQLGWEPPWHNAERLHADGRRAFEIHAGEQFFGSCELRGKYPALTAFCPFHLASRELAEGIGEMRFGAEDTSPFRFHFGRSQDEATHRRQWGVRAQFYNRLELIRMIDQLMYAEGPFDVNGDPERVDDKAADDWMERQEELWGLLDRGARIVFD